MIHSEVLQGIRQIELRMNHIVTEFAAGARASARFTARTTASSRTNPPLDSIRTLKRRERRAPKRLPQWTTVSIPKGLCLAALGFGTESLWDSMMAANFILAPRSLQPPAEFSGGLVPLPDGDHFHKALLLQNREENR